MPHKKEMKMTKQIENKVEYIVALISGFAKEHSLTDSEAYRYLKHYGGIKLADDNYEIMHTLDFSQVLSDVASYCKKIGGML